jgi:peptide/nickel transport system substrate-binding protein
VRKILWLFLTVSIIASLLLVGCGEPETTPTATKTPTSTPTATPTATPSGPQNGGTLRIIGTEAPTGSIGIPENQRGLAFVFMAPMIESLGIWTNSGDIIPRLMKSYEWSADHLSVTVHLQQNVKFHDGTDFNAEVAKWNLDQHMKVGMDGMENVVSTDVIDNNTIKINIKQYQNTWFGKLGGATGMMISPSYLEEKGAEYVDWHPVGTGPFKFKEYKDKEYLLMERFDDYWGSKAHLDAIKYIFIADPVTAQIAFESGEGDIISLMAGGPKMATELSKKGFVVEANPGGLCMCMIPSVTSPSSPLNELKVREAIEYAIDKKAIAKNVGLGYYDALYQYAGSTQLPYDPNFMGREFNPEKAKQLLSEAGYPNGFKTTIYAGTHLAGDEIPAIQAYLKDVGIEADIEIISVAKWIELETNGWPDGLLESPSTLSTDYGTTVLRYLVRPLQPNWFRGIYWDSMYRPDALEKAVQEYIVIPDATGQLAKAREIVKIVFDNAIAIPLWDAKNIGITQPWVHDRFKGLEGLGGPTWSFTETWISSH